MGGKKRSRKIYAKDYKKKILHIISDKELFIGELAMVIKEKIVNDEIDEERFIQYKNFIETYKGQDFAKDLMKLIDENAKNRKK